MNLKGNPGNKGGGRKSAYQELQDAKRLWAIWTTPGIMKEIEQRIASGNESLEDMFHALGYQGDTRTLVAIFNKLYPDQLKGDFNLNLTDDQIARILALKGRSRTTGPASE